MMFLEKNPAYNLRFNPMHYSSHFSSHWYCNGVQFKRGLHRKGSQRFLLLPEKASFVVHPRDRSAFIYKKFGLPQASSIYLPHYGLHILVADHSNVSRIQQKSGWGSSMVDFRRVFIPTFRAGKVHARSFYCQVFSKTSGQIKKFCLWLFAQFNRIRFFFHPHFISARFWDCHGYLYGHIYNAVYRRAQEKISFHFNPGNNSFYSTSNSDRRISNEKNHSLSQPVGRSFWDKFSSHSIFLCFWKRRVLGNWLGAKLSKTFSPSRSTHGFYFFSDRRRVGFYRNYSNSYPIFNFYLEGFYNCLPSQRSFWDSFGNRTNSANWFAGFYKFRSGLRTSPYERTYSAFY